MAAVLSICSSALTPKLSRDQLPTPPFLSSGNALFCIPGPRHSHSLLSRRNSPSFSPLRYASSGAAAELNDPEIEDVGSESDPENEILLTGDAAEVVDAGDGFAPADEITETLSDPSAQSDKPQREEVFAVVMVGSRQYIVFPGRFIYTSRLKGANVDDKIKLNKVLLVGTKTSTYIGKPIVPNATVQAVVEEQTLDKKVSVFKYKKKKHYRRNIGHRQPMTRIRITSITGYQDSPAVTLS